MRAPLSALLLLLAAGAAGAQPVPDLALTPEQLATLPQHEAALSFGNPPVTHALEGPLVWDVLTSSGTVDPARHPAAVRQWLEVRAADGYTAVVALAELSPEFAARPALLAIRMDGAALDHPRMVMPAERRAGRSVRDVTGITVQSLPEPRR